MVDVVRSGLQEITAFPLTKNSLSFPDFKTHLEKMDGLGDRFVFILQGAFAVSFREDKLKLKANGWNIY